MVAAEHAVFLEEAEQSCQRVAVEPGFGGEVIAAAGLVDECVSDAGFGDDVEGAGGNVCEREREEGFGGILWCHIVTVRTGTATRIGVATQVDSRWRRDYWLVAICSA